MAEKKRVIHEISSDSESGCKGGYEPPAKRRETGEDADSTTHLENGAVQERSSDSESLFEEVGGPSAKHWEAGKVADPITKVATTGRTPCRQIFTSHATYQETGNDEQQPSRSISEDLHVLPINSPCAARQGQLSKHAVDPETSQSRAKAPLDPIAVNGVLAQYVLEMLDDTEPMYKVEFQAETQAALGLQNPDYRYETPHGRVTDARDRASIRRALELTCIDYCQRRGHPVPKDLLAECHNESYMSQYRQVQADFDRVWNGDQPVGLYCLPAWTKGFDKWKVPGRSGRGAQLKHGAVYPDGNVSFYGLLDQERQVAKMKKS